MEQIDKYLKESRVEELLGEERLLVNVDFASSLVDNASLGTYKILILGERPKNARLICLFPQHDHKPVLRLSRILETTESFNEKINKRLEKCKSEGLRMAICYGNHVYCLRGVTGTVYIHWATHVNYRSRSKVTSTIHTNVPIVINADNAHKIKGVYILKESDPDRQRLPITAESPEFVVPTGTVLLTCESFKKQTPKIEFVTSSWKTALEHVSSTSFTSVENTINNPYEHSLNLEEGSPTSSDAEILDVHNNNSAADLYITSLVPGSSSVMK